SGAAARFADSELPLQPSGRNALQLADFNDLDFPSLGSRIGCASLELEKRARVRPQGQHGVLVQDLPDMVHLGLSSVMKDTIMREPLEVSRKIVSVAQLPLSCQYVASSLASRRDDGAKSSAGNASYVAPTCALAPQACALGFCQWALVELR